MSRMMLWAGGITIAAAWWLTTGPLRQELFAVAFVVAAASVLWWLTRPD